MFCRYHRATAAAIVLTIAPPAADATELLRRPGLAAATTPDAYYEYDYDYRRPVDMELGRDGIYYVLEEDGAGPDGHSSRVHRFTAAGVEMPPVDLAPHLETATLVTQTEDGMLFVAGQFRNADAELEFGLASLDPTTGATSSFARNLSLPEDIDSFEAAGTDLLYLVRPLAYPSKEVLALDRSGTIVSQFEIARPLDLTGNSLGQLVGLSTGYYDPYPGCDDDEDQYPTGAQLTIYEPDGTPHWVFALPEERLSYSHRVDAFGDLFCIHGTLGMTWVDKFGTKLFAIVLEDVVRADEYSGGLSHVMLDAQRRVRCFASWRDEEYYLETGFLEFQPFPSGTIVTSSPLGVVVSVNGIEHRTPAFVAGKAGTEHEVSSRYVVEDPFRTRDRFSHWSGTAGPSLRLSVGEIPRAVQATFERSYYLRMESSPGGVVSPASGFYPAHTPIEIEAGTDGRFTFMEWSTPRTDVCSMRNNHVWEQTGYDGPDATATIHLYEPTTQYARFEDQGYEFLLSASPSDPYVQSAPALPGQIRQIHLWGTCLRRGLAAFEASITGSMNVVGFEPASGVLNVFDGRDLLLAIGGCPTGPDANFRLGSFIVVDAEGGADICLGPSTSTGERLVADCEEFYTGAWDFVVRGFSSTGNEPCVIGGNGCGEDDGTSPFATDFAAAPGVRRVNVSWHAASRSDVLGFHVYRGPEDGVRQRISAQRISGVGDLSFSDSNVEEHTIYEYYLEAITAGGSEFLGPVTVSTPRFPRLTATDFEIGPNPFRGQVTFSFALPQEDRVHFAIYDVTGRLVRDLADEALPAGRHSLRWDGRSGDGAPVPAGVYFSRAELGSRRQTSRIVYLGGR